MRVVLDARGRLHAGLRLLKSAAAVPLLAVSPPGLANGPDLKAAGAELLACELVDGRVALPELLDDLGARGIMNVLVEGGAHVAASFLSEDLVDALALFTAGKAIGAGHARIARLCRHCMPPPCRRASN